MSGLFRLASMAALCLAPATALAQGLPCRLCTSPTTSFDPAAAAEARVALDLEASLDFDRLILTGPGGGTASLSPGGARSVSGALSELTARAMVGSAVIRGEPGRAVLVSFPGRIDLYSTRGGLIRIDELSHDLPAAPRLDSAGRLAFRFGGRLTIEGDAEGDYRGEIPITVEYL